MINLLVLTEQGLNANNAVELRKAGAELGIKGASKGKKADLIAAIMLLVDAAKAEARRPTKTAPVKMVKRPLSPETPGSYELVREEPVKTEAPAKPARKSVKCIDCGFRRMSKTVIGPDLCDVCLSYAEWENAHNDHGHGNKEFPVRDELTNDCPICHPELDKRYVRNGRSRAGMVIVARGTEVHKSATFKEHAEKAGWSVQITVTTTVVEEDGELHTAIASRGLDKIVLKWNGRAYDYPNSSATLKGKSRKVRNLKEALRLL